MRWPWQKPKPDPEIQRRIDAIKQRVDQQAFLSEQVAQTSKDLTGRTAEQRNWAAGIRERNHITEGLKATYKFRKRRRRPWTA